AQPRGAEVEDLSSGAGPRVVRPVQGEALPLAEHAALARRLGIADVVACRNGDVVRLAPGAPGVIDEIPQGRLYKDGRLLVEADARTGADPRRLGVVGALAGGARPGGAGT